jgi:hypothetical protein
MLNHCMRKSKENKHSRDAVFEYLPFIGICVLISNFVHRFEDSFGGVSGPTSLMRDGMVQLMCLKVWFDANTSNLDIHRWFQTYRVFACGLEHETGQFEDICWSLPTEEVF